MYNNNYSRGKYMKKEENKELLTKELYMQISNDKNVRIAEIKEQRLSKIQSIKSDLELLKSLQEKRKELNNRIKATRRLLKKSRDEKFRLTRELGKQKRLSNSLNDLMVQDEAYIESSYFYPENKPTKKR